MFHIPSKYHQQLTKYSVFFRIAAFMTEKIADSEGGPLGWRPKVDFPDREFRIPGLGAGLTHYILTLKTPNDKARVAVDVITHDDYRPYYPNSTILIVLVHGMNAQPQIDLRTGEGRFYFVPFVNELMAGFCRRELERRVVVAMPRLPGEEEGDTIFPVDLPRGSLNPQNDIINGKYRYYSLAACEQMLAHLLRYLGLYFSCSEIFSLGISYGARALLGTLANYGGVFGGQVIAVSPAAPDTLTAAGRQKADLVKAWLRAEGKYPFLAENRDLIMTIINQLAYVFAAATGRKDDFLAQILAYANASATLAVGASVGLDPESLLCPALKKISHCFPLSDRLHLVALGEDRLVDPNRLVKMANALGIRHTVIEGLDHDGLHTHPIPTSNLFFRCYKDIGRSPMNIPHS